MTISHEPLNDEDREDKNEVLETLNNILDELKILNQYMSMGFDEVLVKEDLND